MQRRRASLGLGVAGWLLLAARAVPAAAGATPTPRPNLVVINLDDTRADGIDRMPVVQARLAAAGVSFSRSFVPNSVCAPSRASLFTGRYSIHHGTRTVAAPLGGATAFRTSGADRQTIAVWLHDAGYATGLFGKYLNDYTGAEVHAGVKGLYYVPPGWDRWRGMLSPEGMGGKFGQSYLITDERGIVSWYAVHSDDAQYSTDLLSTWLREFIADAVGQGKPFFAYFAPVASHGDPVTPAPAERHAKTFPEMTPWRPPNWNEADLSDKPRWVQALTTTTPLFTDAVRQKAYQSLLAVDEAVGALLDELERLGVADRTVIVFTSDNGVGWGEHRQFAQGKECPYEECLRVPLIIRDPRIGDGRRTVDAPVLNIDLAPTLAALAGVAVPVLVDGIAFDAWLRPGPHPTPRGEFLLEHYRQQRGATLAYDEQVSDGDRVRLLIGDARSRPRSSRVFEFDDDGHVGPGAEPVPIGRTPQISFFNLAGRVLATVPGVNVDQLQDADRLTVTARSSNEAAPFWWMERDQAQVMQSETSPIEPPDYFGIRDLARNLTYVEYETGEVELYDLNADPWQLDNRAGDPAYARLRAELAARLAAMLTDFRKR